MGSKYIAAAAALGLLVAAPAANAHTTKTKAPAARCHILTEHRKKVWTKCPKVTRGATGARGAAGLNGVSARDGANDVDGAQGPRGAQGERGPVGPTGAQGISGLEGAFYAVAKYNAGDTNEGAIATVACDANADKYDPSSIKYTAIAGGVQIIGTNGDNSHNTPVSSSFPGRMDWNTNTPIDNRLDGWIVQFGGNGSTIGAPRKVNVWALCVPKPNVPVRTTFQQSA